MPGGYKRGWTPLRRLPHEAMKPFYIEMHEQGDCDVEVWLSDTYEVTIRRSRTEEVAHVSVNLRDRGPARNWRHLQQIKNEVCGELWTGIEIFPPEDKLTDAANQYHLFCFPPGYKPGASKDGGFISIGLGGIGLLDHPIVSDDEQVEEWNNGPHPGRQEPWEEGLTTGRTEHSRPARELLTDKHKELQQAVIEENRRAERRS